MIPFEQLQPRDRAEISRRFVGEPDDFLIEEDAEVEVEENLPLDTTESATEEEEPEAE